MYLFGESAVRSQEQSPLVCERENFLEMLSKVSEMKRIKRESEYNIWEPEIVLIIMLNVFILATLISVRFVVSFSCDP